MAQQPLRSPEDYVSFLIGTTRVLDANSRLFHDEGILESWMPIASALFVILVDKDARKPRLIERVLPNVKFKPVFDGTPPEEFPSLGLTTLLPMMQTYLGDGRVRYEVINHRAEKIPLIDWLSQIAMVQAGKLISVERLIKDARHEEGAGHYSDKLSPVAEAHRSMFFGGIPIAVYAPYIAALGEYISSEIKAQLSL